MLERWRFDRGLRRLADSEIDVLRAYAATDWPDRDMPVTEAPLLALDFELDGLRKDAHLLQAGWLAFDAQAIPLADAQSHDIRSDAQLNDQAVTIHGIGEQRAVLGKPIGEVIAALIEALAGRVMVAHAAGIERHALQSAAKRLWGVELPIRSICTLTLEKRLHPNLVGAEAYRLGTCRARYGLPEYNAHDALTDALAAAELFQAQLAHCPKGQTLAGLETN